ncbi:MAG TPA: hypothetical protein VEL76_04950 [Gemmataceae bacterium]|nr:hypothetical protein [Gemmataceae bacterium]
MAEWQKLAKELLLADGTIDRREVDLMRKELFADGHIDDLELEFLLELKKSAASVVPSFHQLVLDAVKNNILADGIITAQEANWLRRWIISEGRADDTMKKFLGELRAGAKQVAREFETLYKQCLAT